MRPSTLSVRLTSTIASIASQRRDRPGSKPSVTGAVDGFAIGPEQAVPHRHVAEVARVNVALVVQHVRFGPLDDPARPGRSPDVPMLVERDQEAPQASPGGGVRGRMEQASGEQAGTARPA